LQRDASEPLYNIKVQYAPDRSEAFLTMLASAHPKDAQAILPALANTVSDIANGRIDPPQFQVTLAQLRRTEEEFSYKQAHDCDSLVDPRTVALERNRNQRLIDSLTPTDLQAMANGMLSRAPTLVTKSATVGVPGYDELISMLYSPAAAAGKISVTAQLL
jgi:hypothetical protein